MQQMYVIACVLGVGLQVTLLTQTPSILALMGAGPKTALFKEASGYLKVWCCCCRRHVFVFEWFFNLHLFSTSAFLWV